MATVGEIVRRACPYLGLDIPGAVYGSYEREHVELAEMANEIAERIWAAHDWQVLQTRHNITGDGVTLEFATPAAFGRFTKGAEMWSDRYDSPLIYITDFNTWLQYKKKEYGTGVPLWTWRQGLIEFLEAPELDEVQSYYYVSRRVFTAADGSGKNFATDDMDEFRLSDRVLRLGIVWLFKQSKGLPYAEEMAAYERALAEEVMRDKGPIVLTMGRPASRVDAVLAYPKTVT